MMIGVWRSRARCRALTFGWHRRCYNYFFFISTSFAEIQIFISITNGEVLLNQLNVFVVLMKICLKSILSQIKKYWSHFVTLSNSQLFESECWRQIFPSSYLWWHCKLLNVFSGEQFLRLSSQQTTTNVILWGLSE